MAAGQSETSKIAPVKVRTGNPQQRRSGKGPSTQKYIATKVTEGRDANGKPTFTKEVIRYDDATGSNPVVIGTQKSGETQITPTANANASDKIGMAKGGPLSKTSAQQTESTRDSFGLGAEGKDKFNADNNKSGQAKASDAPQESSPASAGAAAQGPAGGEAQARPSFPRDLKYPIDLGSTKQDVIEFLMLKYEPRSASGTSGAGGRIGFGERSEAKNRIIGSCFLPIPSGIQDSSPVSFSDDNLNAFQAAIAAAGITGLTEGPGAGIRQIGSDIRKAGSDENTKDALATFFTEQATGAQNLLARTQGIVLNPNLELLFKGPSLRSFNFTFKMSARNSDEADEIIRIIRFFKQGSRPQRSSSNLFLKSPNTFKIKYLHRAAGTGEHQYIGRVKECACTNVGVQYTPDGQYATYTDGKLVSYAMTLAFKELEPVFNDDYTKLDGDDDTLIGF
tara:strand:- start:49 stop:1401 length:1353 start_codon:yes stop_codon:yes gene_type:complete